MHSKIRGFALALLASAAFGLDAQEDVEGVSQSAQMTEVILDGGSIYINASGDTFQLNGPDGFFFSSDQPHFDFGGEIPNGTYTFSVYRSVGKQGKIVSEAENSKNGREADASPGQAYQLVGSGSFQIIDNTISTGE